MSSFTEVSTARVPTATPERYARQLTSHMGHKMTTKWDADSGTGTMDFDREGPRLGHIDISCEADALVLRLSTDNEHQEKLEFITGIHLARFGAKDSLTIQWIRENGASGTTQGPLTPEEVAAHMRQKRLKIHGQDNH